MSSSDSNNCSRSNGLIRPIQYTAASVSTATVHFTASFIVRTKHLSDGVLLSVPLMQFLTPIGSFARPHQCPVPFAVTRTGNDPFAAVGALADRSVQVEEPEPARASQFQTVRTALAVGYGFPDTVRAFHGDFLGRKFDYPKIIARNGKLERIFVK